MCSPINQKPQPVSPPQHDRVNGNDDRDELQAVEGVKRVASKSIEFVAPPAWGPIVRASKNPESRSGSHNRPGIEAPVKLATYH